MSKIVKAITALNTGNRKYLPEKLSPLFESTVNGESKISEIRTSDGYIKQYRIGITLGAKADVSEMDVFRNKDSLSLAIDRTKRNVIEAIFGEFREDFCMLENAIYNRNFEEARELLRNFRDKMYTEI